MKKIRKTLICIFLIIIMSCPVYADYGSISTDGYYDDWEDKPHTEVYNGEKPSASKINQISLFRDDENIYVHILFADKVRKSIVNLKVNLHTSFGDKSYRLLPDEGSPVFLYEGAADEEDSGQEENVDNNGDSDNIDRDSDNGQQEDETDRGSEDKDKGKDSDKGTESDNDVYGINPDTEPSHVRLVHTDENQSMEVEEEAEASDESVDSESQDDHPEAESSTDSESEDLESENSSEQGDDLDNIKPDKLKDENIEKESDDEVIETEPELLESEDHHKKSVQSGIWSFDVYDGDVVVGYGYITRSEGEADETEFFIPLSTITHQPDGMKEITMKIAVLGKQDIACVGASTGPFGGILTGAGIALFSLAAYTYEKKGYKTIRRKGK